MAESATDAATTVPPAPAALRVAGHLFQPRHCAACRFELTALRLDSEAGSDGFDIPGLHTADRLGTLLAPVSGPFTLAADARLAHRAKFDAAGLYVEAGIHRLKFGIEDYGAVRRIVSVHSAPYSDECNGIALGADVPVRLYLSRSGQVFSCYLRAADGRVQFHRAFHVDACPSQVQVGFCVQSPFSAGASGRFTDITLSPEAMPHRRE